MTLSTHDIAHELYNDNNSDFSWNGANALAEYLSQLEDDMGETLEFDKVGISCDFSEYNSLVEWAKDYFSDWREDLYIEEDADEDDIDSVIQDYIYDHGQLIEFDGGIIVSSF